MAGDDKLSAVASMELLLNLVWLALALLSFGLFAVRNRATIRYSKAPFGTALLALACALVLLFPVISASDDLHPTQAVLEDATKRIQQMVAPQHHGNFSSSSSMVPALLALYLLASLVVLQVWQFDPYEARVLSLSHKPVPGRSPPTF
jgi:hypothetical protein